MSRLNHYINDKITLPYIASLIGLDRIDETYIEKRKYKNNYEYIVRVLINKIN